MSFFFNSSFAFNIVKSFRSVFRREYKAFPVANFPSFVLKKLWSIFFSRSGISVLYSVGSNVDRKCDMLKSHFAESSCIVKWYCSLSGIPATSVMHRTFNNVPRS